MKATKAVSLGLVAGLALLITPPARARPLQQTVDLSITSVETTESGFLVKGTVTADGLNPEGQVVEWDDMSIVADIKDGPGAQYPQLPEAMIIRRPEGAETSFMPGSGAGNTMTEEEYHGVNITTHTVARFSLRNEPVWSAYGGLGDWYETAPASVTMDFEGTIPLEFEGREMRIRASLNHKWGGPHAAWPAFSFHHAIGYEGRLEGQDPPTPTATPEPDTPTPTTTPTPGPCRVSLMPTSVHVMPGGRVDFNGQAFLADGQPIRNALVDVDSGGLEGSGYISSSRTDAQGQFRFTYVSPRDVGGVGSVTLSVSIEGCPITVGATVHFGPTPTPTKMRTPTPTTTPTGTPSPLPPTPTFTPTPTATPTPDCEDEAETMRKLLEWYHTLSLDGRDYGLGSANGPYGNTRSWHKPHGTQVIGNVDGKVIEVETHDAGAILCGDYQHVLLEWLDAIRSSETHGHLLNGGPGCPNLIDYCPIQSYGGIHQAVVIYPTGTNWLNTGIVLDPWYRQTATTYPIADWDAFALPSSVYEGLYTCSTGSSYAKRAHSFKPAEAREMTHALLRCPVEVLLANQRGERIGRLPNGQFINQIPGGFSLAHPEEDGTLLWYFALPGEDCYEAQITGTGAGSFNLITQHGDGPIQTYGDQPIAPGAQAHLTLDPGDPAAPLTLADGRAVSPTSQQGLSASALGTVPLLLFAVSGLAGLGASGLLLALLLQRRRTARASVPASSGPRARVGWEQGYPACVSTSDRGGEEARRPTITFDKLERTYNALKGRHAVGRLSDEELQAEVSKLRLRDERERYWTISGDAGTWYVAQGGRWVRAEPPRGRSAGRRTCPTCGAQVKESLNFCTSCGERLTR